MFAKTIDNKEVETYVYLNRKFTGFAYDYLIDENEEYIAYNHPLCMYVINESVTKEKSPLVAVTISEQPRIYNGPLYKGNENEAVQFVLSMRQPLADVANDRIDGGAFYDKLEEYLKHFKNGK